MDESLYHGSLSALASPSPSNLPVSLDNPTQTKSHGRGKFGGFSLPGKIRNSFPLTEQSGAERAKGGPEGEQAAQAPGFPCSEGMHHSLQAQDASQWGRGTTCP